MTRPDPSATESAADAEDVARWARRASEGDRRAFRRLYERFGDDVHRTARWMLAPDDVDDVIQEVFLRAWEKLPSLSDHAAFGSWLHRLAVNVFLRWRGRRARRREYEPPLERAPNGSDTAPSPDLGIDLERAVAELPDGARKVFILYDVEGFSHREIGEIMGMSHHTSRSQLHRARALLRDRLRGDDT